MKVLGCITSLRQACEPVVCQLVNVSYGGEYEAILTRDHTVTTDDIAAGRYQVQMRCFQNGWFDTSRGAMIYKDYEDLAKRSFERSFISMGIGGLVLVSVIPSIDRKWKPGEVHTIEVLVRGKALHKPVTFYGASGFGI